MISRIAIAGLGPHADFVADLDPAGTTTLSGPSESGKSFVLEALVFALWGRSTTSGKLAPEAVHDAADKAVVEVTLDDGRVVRRTSTRSRATTRSIASGGQRQAYDSEAAFLQGLGDLGDDPEALALVVVPMAWQPLVDGNARAFRDVLARILPKGDVPAEVRALVERQGFDVTDAEARATEKDVMDRRKEARRVRDEAVGRRQAAEERVAALEASPPASAMPVDKGLLDRVARWEAYDRAVAAAGARAASSKAQVAWDQRRAELGDEPIVVDDGAVEKAKAAKAQLDAAAQQVQQAYARWQYVNMQLQPFAGLDPGVCPQCRRPGWEQGGMALAQLQGMAQMVQTEVAQAQAMHQQASGAYEAANIGAEAVREATSRRDGWRKGLKALGPRPEAQSADVPVPPDGDRPTPADVASARDGATRAALADAAVQRWDQELTSAREAVFRENERQTSAAKEADRLDALLEAVRAAPSLVAERQMVALGDLGPVRLRFGDNPAVTVLIDGRPWWLASRGKQVVADLWLRAGLRRALKRPKLPIVVDNVQDVKGQPLPDVGGPVVLLETVDGHGIRVERRTVAPAG